MNSAFGLDLRYALRMLAKNPLFTLVAVATLALGIGANAAMFGIVNATVLQPLAYANAERLVYVRETTPDGDNFSASQPNYLDFRDGSRHLETLAAFQDASLTLADGGEPQRYYGLAVTHDFFTALGVAPQLGRGFIAAESEPGADAATVVLGDALWRERFGGAPDIVGREITLEGRAYLVVGVMPADFEFVDAQLFVPFAPDPGADRGNHWLGMIGTLAPGATIAQAQAELGAIASRIGDEYPKLAGWGVRIQSLAEVVVDDQFRTSAFLLFAAVGFLLLMACANLASLLVARMPQRQGEMGVRAALGAPRGRLVRQLLVESLLLTAAGVIVGLGLAHVAIAALQAAGPEAIPRLDEIHIDATVVTFAVALGAATALLFGLAPALRASRPDLNHVLKQGGRTGLTREHRRASDALVVAQVALAVVLLVGAGLLMRSFMQLRSADTGFDPRQVYAVELQLDDRYAEPWQKVVFFNQLAERLEAVSGIESVGATATDPFSGSNFVNDVTPVDRAAETEPGGYLQAKWRAVTPGFFETLGVPLLRGRLFTADDAWNGPRQIVLTETMAARLWPDDDAVGKELYWGGVSGTPRIVIGVVGDYEDVAPGADSQPLMFLPYNQLPWPKMTVVVGANDTFTGAAGVIREQIRALDAGLAVPTIRPLEQKLADAIAGPRYRSLLLGAFASVALLLAAIGLYGVIAMNVSRRQRELGLRIALGAKPRTIVRRFVVDGARLTLLGLGVGLIGAWGLSRAIASLLYATAPLDPTVFIAAALVLGAAALIASYLPARHAARIDPMEALRDE
ncbi:MAG: ABC transporter permease [Gammaproteobacteria bacterium]